MNGAITFQYLVVVHKCRKLEQPIAFCKKNLQENETIKYVLFVLYLHNTILMMSRIKKSCTYDNYLQSVLAQHEM